MDPTVHTLFRPAPDLSPLGRLWHDALAPMIVRHPSRSSRVLLDLSADAVPLLRVALESTFDNRDPSVPMRSPFVISCVRLTYFPGVRLARIWLAAAWAGFCSHEALELVTVGDLVTRPLDPHVAPFACDRGLRDGLPAVLTPESLVRALGVVMPEGDARSLAKAGA